MADAGPVTPSRVAAAVQATGKLLGTAGSLAAVERISAELNGLGPLQQLVRDPSVTDIFVNAPDSVWLDRGRGIERAPVAFAGEPQLRALASRLVAAGGRRLDDGSPCVDVRLDGGYRVHAVLPPISTAGTLLSVRIRRERVFSLDELRRGGMFGPLIQSVLEQMVERRLSFLISGATGSGKTTLLSTLLGLCDPGERLVLIEDASELNPVHPHVVSLESRHGNLEGGGEVDLGELVRQALRMRPDRLVVGECRGAEVRELLTAMNTGHTGGGGTIHANAAGAVPARLTALGALAGLGQEAVRLQVSSALDVVVHVARSREGRHVACIGVLQESAGGLGVSAALENAGGRLVIGPAWAMLAHRLGIDPGLALGQVQPTVQDLATAQALDLGRTQELGRHQPQQFATDEAQALGQARAFGQAQELAAHQPQQFATLETQEQAAQVRWPETAQASDPAAAHAFNPTQPPDTERVRGRTQGPAGAAA